MGEKARKTMLAIFQVPNKFYEAGGRIADVLGQDWEAAWSHAGNLKNLGRRTE